MTPAPHRSGGHILVVDPDRHARAALVAQLERQGFRVTAVSGGGGMHRALERSHVDIVLIDLRPGDEEGGRLCRALRGERDVPFVIHAAGADALDRIVGLELGADDFLDKPADPRELLARLRNLLRRAQGAHAAPRARWYRFGGWQLDAVARELRDPEGSLRALRTAEFRVLVTLLAHGNRVVSRLKLIELARGRAAGPFDRCVDVRISRLRRLLGDDARASRIIKTVHGEGYVIGVPVERV